MTGKGKNLRIAQELKERIISGVYPVGSKLEPLSALTKQFNSTVITMSRALDILENEDLIERVNGLGIFVKQQVKHRFAIVFDSKAEMGLFAHKAIFMKYFIDYCHDNGYEYKVFEDIDTAKDCSRVRKHLQDKNYDAILISSREFAENSKKYLHGIPIAAIGLYAYKELDTCIHSYTSWTTEAYQHLIKSGCTKIGIVTNWDQMHLWQKSEIVTQEEIYANMSAAYPEIFDPELFCITSLSPHDGYLKTCSLLNKVAPGEKIGLVVTDFLLTHGVISAVLQKQYRMWDNLYLISHALDGFSLSQFSIPVISYKANVDREITEIDALLKKYLATGEMEKGIKTIHGMFIYPEGY